MCAPPQDPGGPISSAPLSVSAPIHSTLAYHLPKVPSLVDYLPQPGIHSAHKSPAHEQRFLHCPLGVVSEFSTQEKFRRNNLLRSLLEDIMLHLCPKHIILLRLQVYLGTGGVILVTTTAEGKIARCVEQYSRPCVVWPQPTFTALLHLISQQ